MSNWVLKAKNSKPFFKSASAVGDSAGLAPGAGKSAPGSSGGATSAGLEAPSKITDVVIWLPVYDSRIVLFTTHCPWVLQQIFI